MKKFSHDDIRSGITAAICFVIAGLIAGTSRFSGLLFVPSITRYNTDREKASFPFLLCYATRNVIGPLVGFFGKKFGIKAVTVSGGFLSSFALVACFFAEDILTITILWGILFGAGFGLATLLLAEILSMHFSKHLDKAVGIFLAGDSTISFLLSPLAEFCLRKYELSGTFLILSGVALNSIPAALHLQVPKRSIINIKQGEASIAFKHKDAVSFDKTNYEGSGHDVAPAMSTEDEVNRKSEIYIFKVFLDPIYVILLFTNCSLLYSFNTIATVFADFSIDHGVSSDEAVYILMGFFFTNAIGCLFLGSVTDSGCLTKTNFYVVCFSGMGISLFASIFLSGFAAMMTCAIILGLCTGGVVMISVGLVKLYVDKDCVGVAIASRYSLYGPLSFTQAPLIGYFRDTLQSYNGLFYMLVGISCVCVILSLLIPVIHRSRVNREGQLKIKPTG